MPFIVAIASLAGPMLLLVAPVSLAAVKDCVDWTPPVQAVATDTGKNCPRPPFIAM
ncbi:MAG: hypothetical protein ABW039_04065 [Sphingobium sp.]